MHTRVWWSARETQRADESLYIPLSQVVVFRLTLVGMSICLRPRMQEAVILNASNISTSGRPTHGGHETGTQNYGTL